MLHVYVAYDWGDEIDLERARQLVPAAVHVLPRKPRTPTWMGYEPQPLRIGLAPISVALPSIKSVDAAVDVTMFDLGAVSVALHLPLNCDAGQLLKIATSLSEPKDLLQTVRASCAPLFEKLKPSIQKPLWNDLNEEYFVFQINPGALPAPQKLLIEQRRWLTALVRLECEELSDAEVAEALRMHLSYGPDDLLVVDWAAALVVDDDCDEVLDVISFANLQLLELRHIDGRVDANLGQAYDLIRELARSTLPFWRFNTRPLRALGELKLEATVMLERSTSALKLVGDPYLARAYQLLGARFHLDEWGQSIRRAIGVLESIHETVFNQASSYRMEILEAIIVFLILFEIVMAFVRG